jgi:hypothetical protein
MRCNQLAVEWVQGRFLLGGSSTVLLSVMLRHYIAIRNLALAKSLPSQPKLGYAQFASG